METFKITAIILLIMAVSCKKNQVINFCPPADVLHCEKDFCLKYKQSDTVAFQVNLSEYNGEELVIKGDMEPIYSGTATATVANKLDDTNGNFSALPYNIVGWTVKNLTDDTYAVIVDDMSNNSTRIALSVNIMASGEDYEILPFHRTNGILTYNETSGYWERSGGSTADYLVQDNILKAGHYYKVTFDLTSVSGGSAMVAYDDAGNLVATPYAETGTYTTYFLSQSENLYIHTTGQMAIDNIEVKLMSSVGLLITDCDGTVLIDGVTDYNTYYEGLAGKGEVQVEFLWSDLGLSDGVYFVCVTDRATLAASLLINSEFDSNLWGTSDDPATTDKLIDTEGLFVSSGLPIGSSVHNQSTSLLPSVVTSIDSETQIGISADAFPSGCCDPYYIFYGWKTGSTNGVTNFGLINNEYGRVLHVASSATTDTFEPVSINLDATKNYVLQYNITDESAFFGSYQVDGTIMYDTATVTGQQLAVLAGGENEVDIEGLAITRLYIETTEQGVFGIDYFRLYEKPSCQGEAKCITLDDHSGTALLAWTNDENFKLTSTDHINYEDFTYVQKLRLTIKFGDPFFEKEKEVFRYDNGKRENIYSRSTEIVRLVTENIPPYLHRALAIGLDHDTFTVDGIEYVSEEDSYNPEYRRSSSLAPARIELINADMRNENSKC